MYVCMYVCMYLYIYIYHILYNTIYNIYIYLLAIPLHQTPSQVVIFIIGKEGFTDEYFYVDPSCPPHTWDGLSHAHFYEFHACNAYMVACRAIN